MATATIVLCTHKILEDSLVKVTGYGVEQQISLFLSNQLRTVNMHLIGHKIWQKILFKKILFARMTNKIL